MTIACWRSECDTYIYMYWAIPCTTPTDDKISRPPYDSLGAVQPPMHGSTLFNIAIYPLGQWSLPHWTRRTVLVWITPCDRQTMSSVGGVCILNGIAHYGYSSLFFTAALASYCMAVNLALVVLMCCYQWFLSSTSDLLFQERMVIQLMLCVN